MDNEINKIERFFEKNIKDIVNNLFNKLKEENIDVNVGRVDLEKKQLEVYEGIYRNYEKELIRVKKEGIKKFGENPYLDFIFGMTVQKMVNNRQEL